MKGDLPYGNITPQAQPISSFIRPAQQNTAGAARPSMLSSPKGITTQQMAGTSGVRGYNSMAEIVDALGPLNRNLMSTYQRAYELNATQKIQEGYSLEAQNQAARAMRGLQEQQEIGAAQAAGTITQLEATDPVGAQLLRESNPWRAVGRRRFLAQAAAGDISAALANDLSSNAGALSALQPGSPELAARKAALSQQVMSSYGLKGDELEANYYVTPALNKAWDAYTKEHNKLYTQELQRSSIEASTVAIGSSIAQWMSEGITLPDGTVVRSGTPEFGYLGGMLLTQQLDSGLQMLAGKDKATALKQIREQLLPTFGAIPGAAELLQNVRGGNAQMPMEQRPRWVDSMPYTVLRGGVQGLELRNRQYEAQQSQLGQGVEADYQQSVAIHEYGSPEYKAALAELRGKWGAAGYRDIDKFISSEVKNAGGVAIALDPTDPIELAELDNQIRQAPPEYFTPEGRKQLAETIRRRASLEPTPEKQRAKATELWKAAAARDKELSKLPTGSGRVISEQVSVLMSDPEIQKLDVGKKAQNAFSIPGVTMDQAVNASSNVQYKEYYAGVQALMRAEVTKLTNEWYQKPENAGAERIPDAQFNAIALQARQNIVASQERKDLYQRVTGQNAAGQTTQNQPQQPAAPAKAWQSLPDVEVRQYRKKAIIKPRDLYTELRQLQSGKPVSQALINLSNRAGVNKYEFLRQQLRFNPSIDPTGEVQRYLQEKAKTDKANTTISRASYSAFSGTGLGVISPFAPGSWLMRMMPRTTVRSAPRGGGGLPPVNGSDIPGGRVYGTGEVLGQSQIEQLARQAGWPEHLIPTIGAVAMAESGGRSGVVNDNRNSGDLSYGLMQINMIDELGPERMRAYGLKSYDDLKDPLTNMRVALQIYREQGIGAWGAYTNGSYRRFAR